MSALLKCSYRKGLEKASQHIKIWRSRGRRVPWFKRRKWTWDEKTRSASCQSNREGYKTQHLNPCFRHLHWSAGRSQQFKGRGWDVCMVSEGSTSVSKHRQSPSPGFTKRMVPRVTFFRYFCTSKSWCTSSENWLEELYTLNIWKIQCRCRFQRA